MPRKSLEDFNCSWARAADAIGDKWSIMIIRDAFFGVRTFSAFAKNTGISKNILSQRLEHLQRHGVIAKQPVGLGANRYDYSLTEKGHALLPIIIALGQWGDEWIFGEGGAPYVVVDRKARQPIKTIRVEASDGTELGIDDVTFTAGPGAKEVNVAVADEIEKSLEASEPPAKRKKARA